MAIQNLKFGGVSVQDVTFNGQVVNTVKYNGVIVWERGEPAVHDYFYVLNNGDVDGTVGWTLTGGAVKPYYSLDGGVTWLYDWEEIGSLTLTPGQKAHFKWNRSEGGTWHTSANYISIFLSSSTFSLGGDLRSLIYGADFEYEGGLNGYDFYQFAMNSVTITDISDLKFNFTGCFSGHCFHQMFSGCTALVNGITELNLHATNGKDYVFANMFYKCTALLNAPDISLTGSTGNYGLYYMFYGCTALSSPISVSANGVSTSGCQGMFYNCSNITSASLSLGSVLGSGCHSMFAYCYALTTVSALSYSITSGTQQFQNCFISCTSLTSCPDLPNVTLTSRCYMQMFRECTSLVTAPSVLSTVSSTQFAQYMFYGCTSLTSARFSTTTNLVASHVKYCFGGNITTTGVLHVASGKSSIWSTSGNQSKPTYWSVVEDA